MNKPSPGKEWFWSLQASMYRPSLATQKQLARESKAASLEAGKDSWDSFMDQSADGTEQCPREESTCHETDHD